MKHTSASGEYYSTHKKKMVSLLQGYIYVSTFLHVFVSADVGYVNLSEHIWQTKKLGASQHKHRCNLCLGGEHNLASARVCIKGRSQSEASAQVAQRGGA